MQGKTLIITGGGSGFGREVALKLAKKGTNISVVDISKENGEETVRLCKELDCDAIFIQADVSKVEDVKSMWLRRLTTLEKSIYFSTMREFPDLEFAPWNVLLKNSMPLLT